MTEEAKKKCSGPCGLLLPEHEFDMTDYGKLKNKCAKCIGAEGYIKTRIRLLKRHPDYYTTCGICGHIHARGRNCVRCIRNENRKLLKEKYGSG